MKTVRTGVATVAVAFFGLAVIATSVMAHQVDRAEQATEVHSETGEVENLYMISAEDLTHELGHVVHGQVPSQELLNELEAELAQYLDEHTAVRADGDRCELEDNEFVAYPAGDGRLHYYQMWRCPTEVHEIEIKNRIMHDHHHGGYRHVGQVQVGDEVYPTVFEPRFPAYTVYPEFVGEDGDVVVEVDDDEEESEETEVSQDDDDDEQDEPDLGFVMVLAGFVLLGLVGLVGFLEGR